MHLVVGVHHFKTNTQCMKTNKAKRQMDHQDWKPIVWRKASEKKPTGRGATGHPGVDMANRRLEAETETFRPLASTRAFRTRLCQARTANAWTQKELAGRCNVPVKTIQMYESGAAMPSPQMIVRMGRVLKTPLARARD